MFCLRWLRFSSFHRMYSWIGLYSVSLIFCYTHNAITFNCVVCQRSLQQTFNNKWVNSLKTGLTTESISLDLSMYDWATSTELNSTSVFICLSMKAILHELYLDTGSFYQNFSLLPCLDILIDEVFLQTYIQTTTNLP